MGLGQVSDYRRQQVRRNRRNYADTQPAYQPVARGARKVAQFIDQTQNDADAQGELLAETCQPDLPRTSFKERRSKRFLQLLDLHRQCRLRDGASVRSPSEMSVTREGFEIA